MFNGNMIIKDIIQVYPRAEKVFLRHGIKIGKNDDGLFKSIDHAAKMYNANRDTILNDLNSEV